MKYVMGKKKILILDDNANVRKTVSDILSIKGYAPISVPAGRQAIQKIEEEGSDLAVALIDLKLEDMAGLDVMKKCKELSPLTECVILTGNASQESAIDAVNLGAYCYLQKPVDVDQLLIAIRRAIDKMDADRALRISEEKYRNILENIEDGYYENDLDGNITFFNESFLKMFGYPENELLRTNYKTLIVEEYIDRVQEAYNRVYRTETPAKNSAWEIRRKDGTQRHIEASVSLIKNSYDETIGFRGTVRDVTERKQSEEALRQSEEKFRTLIESTLDIIFTVDERGIITYVNPRFGEVTGYSVSELIGCFFTEIVAPECIKSVVDHFEHGMRGETVPIYEIVLIHKNGNRIPVEFLETTLYDADGNAISRFGVGRDISERIRVQEEKRRLESQLQQAQKMEAVGTLAGGIAHDFNNILMGIQGNVSLMILDMDQAHPDYDRLKNVEKYVRNGAELTKQLLGFGRGGKYEVRLIYLNDLIINSSDMFGRTRKEIKIHRKLQKNIWPVEVDQGQIDQVLLNLYVNASQAMPGGGELYIETTNINLNENDVMLYDIQPGKYVKLSVTDTGIGMDESTMQRIFEPFFTTKEMGRGTGLGLASSYGIIKNHGGIIDVHSEKDIGSTFDIYLPASTKEIVEKVLHTEAKISKGDETILLVDDEDIIVDTVTELLRALGYKVITAKSGKDALEIFKNSGNHIGLVILGMIMPDMNGEKVYDILKTMNPDVKVLLSSGYSIAGSATKILEKDCDGFIQKPFDLEHLSAKIREIIDDG
jgi:PAS domain S-box-containing protein